MRERTQWEYRRRTAFAWNEMEVMQEMGHEGWELCAVWGIFLYFKRQLRDIDGSGR